MNPSAAPKAEVAAPGNWKGVDETVIERIAVAAGRPPRAPYINTDQGDLLLALFLLAGAVGGFIGGYCFCLLFPPHGRASKRTAPRAAAADFHAAGQ